MKQEKKARALKYPLPPAQSMDEMMEFARKPGWRQTINTALLKKMGVATNNEGRVLKALRFSGLIDESGTPTLQFDSLKKDYQATMRQIVKEKYGELLEVFPPDTITRDRLKNYFGNTKQQGAGRRASFFVWLCNEAGIGLPKIEEEKARHKSK